MTGRRGGGLAHGGTGARTIPYLAGALPVIVAKPVRIEAVLADRDYYSGSTGRWPHHADTALSRGATGR